MDSSQPDNATDALESRRNPTGRQPGIGRRLLYAVATPVLIVVVRTLWASCRVHALVGEEHVEQLKAAGKASVPCYWHRDIFVCLMTIRRWIQRGFSAGIIISPSVDGDVPARIAERWGAEVIRGSAKRTGALAMRDMHATMKRGVSIVTAADGPVGPARYFKSGILLAARVGLAPLLPIGCAATRAWRFDTWDRFMLPKPFAKIAIIVGEPMQVPARAGAEEQEAFRATMEATLDELHETARRALPGSDAT